MSVQIHDSWKPVLQSEFEKPYFEEIRLFLKQELGAEKTIYPHPKNIFAAFNACPFDKLKVVVLGQDPYHGPGQAHGLCFSVQKGCKVPPSLQNIYKEIKDDLGLAIPEHGCLTDWAEQGILLLNATLTVEAHQPNSHSKIGWQEFTDGVIKKISAQKSGVVFLLWGRYAQSKQSLIDTSKHHILTSPHPSPFSAHSGFFGCKHFSKTNELLSFEDQEPINWKIV